MVGDTVCGFKACPPSIKSTFIPMAFHRCPLAFLVIISLQQLRFCAKPWLGEGLGGERPLGGRGAGGRRTYCEQLYVEKVQYGHDFCEA